MNLALKVYVPLSGMMFLEYAVLGAWAPVLAARCLGPLKLSGKQTGWIYGTLPLACIISPLIAAQLAERWIATEWILLAAHLAGAVLLFFAARQQTFGGLFTLMGLYSLCYAATIPLVNSLMFFHLTDRAAQSPGIFIWAPIAWALAGWALTAWRWTATSEGDGSDCLYLAAILSVAMAASCLFLPHTPPKGTPADALPFVKAFSMLGDPQVLVFMVISLVVAGMMQFYFLGTAQFMQDVGVKSKSVPAYMAIAPAAQAVATALLLGFLLDRLGYRWTLPIGIACWLVLYVVYAALLPRFFIIASQALHGLAFALFLIAGYNYIDEVAPEDAKDSAQALLFLVTIGLGLFVGTQLTGVVMDRFSTGGKFNWRRIYLVPCGLMLASTLVLVALFRGEPQPLNVKTVFGGQLPCHTARPSGRGRSVAAAPTGGGDAVRMLVSSRGHFSFAFRSLMMRLRARIADKARRVSVWPFSTASY